MNRRMDATSSEILLRTAERKSTRIPIDIDEKNGKCKTHCSFQALGPFRRLRNCRDV